MASTLSARLLILAQSSQIPDSTVLTGAREISLSNGTEGQRWTQGTGSGQVDRQYYRDGSLGAGAIDGYNLLGPGGLKDIDGQLIDADEIKGIRLEVLTGIISFAGAPADHLPCFTDAGKGLKLAAGQTIGIDFGAAGLALGASGKFDIKELSITAGATYRLWLVVAQ